MPIKSLIRTIPHHPKQGIMFRDITTLLQDPKGLTLVVDALAEQYQNKTIDKIAGIESRGFIIGAALAYKLGVGFVPIRKSGKLPAETISQDYALEYGSDTLEVHIDAAASGEKVLIIDDLIATGGTAEAAVLLLKQLGANIVACAFVIDLPDLGGISRLEKLGINTSALCAFDGE